MYPRTFEVFGLRLTIWNVVFLAAIVCGYLVLRATCRRIPEPAPRRFLALRYLLIVYFCALSAQLFAYAFDSNTTMLPPTSVAWTSYYLNPLIGPKTLYGAIVGLPLAVLAVALVFRDVPPSRLLDVMTPAAFATIGVARFGCLLQGCCYGVRTEAFGLRLPPDSAAYFDQVEAGLIEAGSATLPVFPAQALSSIALLLVGAWTFRRLVRGDMNVFPAAVVVYSIFRFAIEFLRDDPARNAFGPFSTSQWIAILILAAYATSRLLPRSRPAASFSDFRL